METKPLQVLVVDDDIDAAESMAMLLELHGHKAATVHDGFEVLEASGRVRPDVILLDVGLPGINGYQAAALIRQDSVLRKTFLVALTGWDSDAHKRASAEAGFDLHLTKPVEPEALLEVLEAVKGRNRVGADPLAT